MPEFILDHGSPEGERAFAKLDSFTQGYIEALFFTSTGYAEDEDLQHASFAELAPAALERIEADCAKFQAERIGELHTWDGVCQVFNESRWAEAGRDFWYTRCGHGCGFWDGDWPEPYASRLTKLAVSFGNVDLCRGDDGRLYLS